jgi:lysozyme
MAGAGAGAAALLMLATTTVGQFEGLRTVAYRDIVGVPTACYGETRGIRMGMRFTKAQCDAMLLKGLDEFADKMEACITRPMGDDAYVAFLSLGWNIGPAALCKSSAVRLYNAGDRRASCRAFLMWNKAGGRVVPGLTKRREAERDLCLKGI